MQEYNMPDYKVRGVGSGKPMYNRRTIGIEDKRKDKKKVSNLITNNPFVPVESYPVRPRGEERGKFKFKLPKLKFSGKGKRTAMRGKIK
tara:strand:+ start:2716 stop:2982 length:267 start_codon:yes stop_codon:yes gene_type:complete